MGLLDDEASVRDEDLISQLRLDHTDARAWMHLGRQNRTVPVELIRQNR